MLQNSELANVNGHIDFESSRLEANHPYLAERGFTADTVRHFGLGYCSKGLMAGRIVIPLHDQAGHLVGYAGRIVDNSAISAETPKYMFHSTRVGNNACHEFRKSYLAYNMNATPNVVDHLIVVEGMPSVWWLQQAGIQNAVALMGSMCSEEQGKLLVTKTSVGGRITVFPDSDDAGMRFIQGVFAQVGRRRWMQWIGIERWRQPTSCCPSELAELLRE